MIKILCGQCWLKFHRDNALEKINVWYVNGEVRKLYSCNVCHSYTWVVEK